MRSFLMALVALAASSDMAPSESQPTQGTPAIGMNLTGITNYSQEFPFLDYFKSAAAPLNNPTLDANLNVTGVQPGKNAGYSLMLDPAPNRYVILYDGSPATWAYSPSPKKNGMFGSVSVTKQSPGRMEFSTSTGGSINFGVNAIDSANPIRNIHIVRADQEAAFKAGAIFNPDFLALVKHFATLRTMDWTCTNASPLVSWSQRPTTRLATWDCVPIEVQVALANAANADLWLNIPAHADDDYIRQAVTLVRDTLAPTHKLHLEYSNEVWNASFEQHRYAEAQADATWPTKGLDWRKSQVWNGYRAAQMAAIARSVFGTDADRRLSVVIGTWPGWATADLDNAIADGVRRAGLGTIASLFKEYAVTTYFGDELGVVPGNEVDRATVLGWAAQGDAGLDKAFQEIEHGGLLAGKQGSLDDRIRSYARHGAQAKAWGLNMVAYEGGVSWYYFMAPDKAPYDALFARMLADPRMGALTTKMVKSFGAAGGTLLNQFADIGGNSQWGPWGMQPTLKAQTPRSKALIEASGH